ASPFWKCSPAGSATSAALRSMRTCPRTPASTWSLPRRKSACPSPWFPTAPRGTTSSIDKKPRQASPWGCRIFYAKASYARSRKYALVSQGGKGENAMCGIVGYIGEEQAAPILLNGLQKLEYRGYDSAGVAVYNDTGVHVVKSKGRLSVLDGILQGGKELPGTVGIGHTRWATHGAPSDVNSHPQVSDGGLFAVVHNGIIENYLYLKNHLIRRGVEFVSDTDTEVVAQMLEYYYKGDVLETIQKVISKVEGSYALGIICADCPDRIFAVRKDSPLIIGIGEGENYIASDVPAIL